jgi:choline dehydrogenase-like flavoprotein
MANIQADLSILPSMTSANPYATALMIGEKAFDIIADELHMWYNMIFHLLDKWLKRTVEIL